MGPQPVRNGGSGISCPDVEQSASGAGVGGFRRKLPREAPTHRRRVGLRSVGFTSTPGRETSRENSDGLAPEFRHARPGRQGSGTRARDASQGRATRGTRHTQRQRPQEKKTGFKLPVAKDEPRVSFRNAPSRSDAPVVSRVCHSEEISPGKTGVELLRLSSRDTPA
ncbi:hypothetical protein HPB47_025830 [Ixodes persulcatus]|uniref:Uncharacterized protein n=1 Tax=Ixodes persulcatus TaxID=34615 RepID=A0AC60Q0Z5_IXOPE|nr:hypothetical protein HPB47_025830 [Ixodes persulcatus]